MCSKSANGFKVIPIRFSADSTSTHDLFLKEHSVRNYDESKPAGRTLFVLNVPPYATQSSLKNVFSEAGVISSVIIQNSIQADERKSTNNGFKVAYIVFKSRNSLLKALKLNVLKPLSSKENPIKVGLYKWVDMYNSSIYDPKVLAEEAKKFVTKVDKVEKKKSKQKEETDEDGWTIVTKKGRNPGLARKESVQNKILGKIKVGSKKKELKNFYTFQIRESKMRNIEELRKSYEEAKNKVKLMKSIRRFKPY